MFGDSTVSFHGRISSLLFGGSLNGNFLFSVLGEQSTFWCKDEKSKEDILKNKLVFINQKNATIVSDWSVEEGNLLRIKNDWIGIEGLPLSCGTHMHLDLLVLCVMGSSKWQRRHWKIKVRGHKSELISPIFEIPFGTGPISVGWFNLEVLPRGQPGGASLCGVS